MRRSLWNKWHVREPNEVGYTPKYKFWGPIRNSGPVSKSKKKEGENQSHPVAQFFRGPISGS